MRVKTLLVAAALATMSIAASAGILTDLNSMVMSNTTAPGTMSTKDRVGVFMGGFAMRTSTRPALMRAVAALTCSAVRSVSSTASS
jgi:hypothetical protein